MIQLEREATKEVYKFLTKVKNNIIRFLNWKSKLLDLNASINSLFIDALTSTKLLKKLWIYFQKSWETWNKYINKTIWLWISFDKIEDSMQEYFVKIEEEFNVLSWEENIVNNMISTIKVLASQWAQEWLSPWQIWRRIAENTIFSKDKANMIAVREMWIWYEIWKENTIKKFLQENPDQSIKKSWVTVWDSRVTDTHKKNERDWWINLSESFSWTWDRIAPANDNPRCRCSVVYKII